MADAKRCDRCKKYYTLTENPMDIIGVNVLRVSSSFNNRNDLCPDCATKLANFLNNIEEEVENADN